MAESNRAPAKGLAEEHKRVFVRELAGKYSRLYPQLLEQPRVYKTKLVPWEGGPAKFGKSIIDPQRALITQAFHVHIEDFAPGGRGQKHGHMNSAVFYILEGKGYDIHDGQRYDWEAGDACIVENGCVHQHFNADPDRPARALVVKAKPAFLFFHLLFQKKVEDEPTEPNASYKNYRPTD